MDCVPNFSVASFQCALNMLVERCLRLFSDTLVVISSLCVRCFEKEPSLRNSPLSLSGSGKSYLSHYDSFK
jgi:hypothetical protein